MVSLEPIELLPQAAGDPGEQNRPTTYDCDKTEYTHLYLRHQAGDTPETSGGIICATRHTTIAIHFTLKPGKQPKFSSSRVIGTLRANEPEPLFCRDGGSIRGL
jgi:hypothetical protein